MTGAIGLLGTRPSYELMRDCDTLLIVGSNFPYSQFLPEFGAGAGGADRPRRRADRDALPDRGQPGRRRRRRRCGRCCRGCRPDRPVLAGEDRAERRPTGGSTMERQAMVDAEPVNPMRIVWELSQRLPRQRDRHRRLRLGGQLVRPAAARSAATCAARCPGTLATMGAAVPYAIGAKFAHPDRPAIALTGDGAMQMNGMAELLTIARYADRWSDPRLRGVRAAQQRPQPGHLGAAGDGRGAEVRGVAGAAGRLLRRLRPRASAWRRSPCARPTSSGPAWDRVLAADRPAVLDVYCDPEVPPIPPHATLEEADVDDRGGAEGRPVGAAPRGRRESRPSSRSSSPGTARRESGVVPAG